MASEDASLVFMRAFLLAQRSKAPEIRIEHLLAALDEDMPMAVESSIRPEPPFLPVPHQDLPLSPGAAAALGPLGDISHVSLKALLRDTEHTRQMTRLITTATRKASIGPARAASALQT